MLLANKLKQEPRNWTINGRITETNFVDGVIIAMVYVAEETNTY